MTLRRIIHSASALLTFASLLAANGALAQSASEGEAPKLFAALSSSTRFYPNANAALTGFTLGSLYKPSEKCVHIAGELFARFGRKDATPEDLKMRTAGGAIGALWGTGDWDHWFGAGAMFDLGWGRVGAKDEFVSSAYLRALLLWRLRGEFWVNLDVRTGYVIAPITVNDVGIKGPLIGLGIGVSWGKDEDEYAPN